MSLIEKLNNILPLGGKEFERATAKSLQVINYIDDKELGSILNLLRENGIEITKARELKVLVNSLSDLKKKLSLLSNHVEMFRQNPLLLNRNVIELNRLIQYYEQNKIPYVVDGSYSMAMFTPAAYRNVFDNGTRSLEQDIVSFDTPVFDNNDNSNVVSFSEIADLNTKKEESNLDLGNSEITDFHKLKEDLEAQLAALNDTTFSFDDIEPETFGMGGRAA